MNGGKLRIMTIVMMIDIKGLAHDPHLNSMLQELSTMFTWRLEKSNADAVLRCKSTKVSPERELGDS